MLHQRKARIAAIQTAIKSDAHHTCHHESNEQRTESNDVAPTSETAPADSSVKTEEVGGAKSASTECVKSESAATPATPTSTSTKKQSAPAEAEEAEEENEDDSCNESEGTLPEEEEDLRLSAEELAKKIERLTRQAEQNLQNLNASSYQMRATPLGQDRFYRRYWTLPTAGGVYVEGMESAEPGIYNELKNQPDHAKKRHRNEGDEGSEHSEEDRPRPSKEAREDNEGGSGDEVVNGTDAGAVSDDEDEDGDENGDDEEDEEVTSITKNEEMTEYSEDCGGDKPVSAAEDKKNDDSVLKDDIKSLISETDNLKAEEKNSKAALKIESDDKKENENVLVKLEESEEPKNTVEEVSVMKEDVKPNVEDIKPILKAEDGVGPDKTKGEDALLNSVKVDLSTRLSDSGLASAFQGEKDAQKNEDSESRTMDTDTKPNVNHLDANTQVPKLLLCFEHS